MTATPAQYWKERAEKAESLIEQHNAGCDLLSERVSKLESALREIAKGDGPFDRDPLTQIENMKQIALDALTGDKQT